MNSVNNSLITHLDPKSPVAEAFRTLRTNLQFSALDRELRTLLVTSAGPGEGKSTITLNLAIAITQSGKEVILVDADLRKPVIHKRFGLRNEIGLTNILVHGPAEEALQETAVPNLKVVTSGPIPPNPAEMLASGMMDKVRDFLKERAEMVLFDCSPVVAVTDAAVLSRKVDGVLLVVQLGAVEREAARQAKALLENVDAPLLGVVINNVAESSGYYYYYYYTSDDDD
ncbi:MAG: CpsD/CapB family tyrosine-protein kinase [Firmicutes bacterium]|nr:CpsD/CapB family tyrosine-protein kinase [Bacillota bacterium]